ncbi:MAG: diacylglycerol kinase family protein [Alphaproteobacteria bacterium]|nr:diacylglycerol kinase family protein [Alphaproteobacteria bacterium]
MNNRKYLIFYNPISGGLSKDKIIQFLEDFFTLNQVTFWVTPTQINTDYQNEKNLVLQNNITDIVIIGGDGTIHNIFKAFYNLNIYFTILPFGSGNGLAKHLNISTNLNNIKQLLLSSVCIQLDVYYFNNDFMYIVGGIGQDGYIAHQFAQSKNRGTLNYIKLLFNRPLHHYNFSLEIQNEVLNLDAHYISFGNGNYYGKAAKLCNFAKLDDGLLDVIIVPKQKPTFKILTYLNYLQFIQKHELPYQNLAKFNNHAIYYLQTNALTIKNHSDAPMHLDGEPFFANNTLTVSLSPYKIKLRV